MKCRYAIDSEPGAKAGWIWLKTCSDGADVTPSPEIKELNDGVYLFEIDFDAHPDDIAGRVSIERKRADGSPFTDRVLVTCYRVDAMPKTVEVITRFVPR